MKTKVQVKDIGRSEYYATFIFEGLPNGFDKGSHGEVMDPSQHQP